MKKYIVTIAFFLTICYSAYPSYKVYMIHGYGGNGMELRKIAKALKSEGYVLENFNYKSMHTDVDSAAMILYKRLSAETADTISFVTHSMGGIVVRSLFSNIKDARQIPILHRIVMLAPPNAGSPVADFYSQYHWVEKLIGPNVHNLTTDAESGAQKYPVPTCEFGIVIGEAGRKRWISIPLPEGNDGIVPIESAKMDQAKDIYYIEATHVTILLKQETCDQVLSFLKKGYFGYS